MRLSALGGGGRGSGARSCSPAGGSDWADLHQLSRSKYSGKNFEYHSFMYSGVRRCSGGNFSPNMLPPISLWLPRAVMCCGKVGRPGSLCTSSSEACIELWNLHIGALGGRVSAAAELPVISLGVPTSGLLDSWTQTPGSLWKPSGSARRAGACLGGSALQGLKN